MNWEDPLRWGDADHDELAFDAAPPLDVDPASAGDCLFDMITTLKFEGVLGAHQACVLSYWASLAGAVGEVGTLSKAPGDPNTGHYSRHFDSVLGISTDDARKYLIRVPAWRKHDGMRTTRLVPAVPSFEALAEELADDPSIKGIMRDTFDDWPPVYRHHAVVLRCARGEAIPIAFYLDGVPLAKRDSVLGFWIVNLASGKRHCLVVLRKGFMCKCGCRGWCSLWPIFEFLA